MKISLTATNSVQSSSKGGLGTGESKINTEYSILRDNSENSDFQANSTLPNTIRPPSKHLSCWFQCVDEDMHSSCGQLVLLVSGATRPQPTVRRHPTNHTFIHQRIIITVTRLTCPVQFWCRATASPQSRLR